MPSVPHAAAPGRSVQFSSTTPSSAPDPNLAHDLFANPTEGGPSYQSSPAVIATSSHRNHQRHVLPRRFLGPMPEAVLHSDQVQEKRRRLHDLRKGAVQRLRRGSDDNEAGSNLRDFAVTIERRGVGKVLQRITVKKKNFRGEEVEEELDLHSDEEGEQTGTGKKLKKRKDVWTGESFNIGREFTSVAVENDSTEEEEEEGDEDREGPFADDSSRPSLPTRPSNTSRTTQETFVTARSYPSEGLDSASTSRSTLGVAVEGYELTEGPPRSIEESTSTSLNLDRTPHTRVSQASSTRPLVGTLDHLDDESHASTSPVSAKDSKRHRSVSNIRGRLKSALRHSSRELRQDGDQGSQTQSQSATETHSRLNTKRPVNGKSKSVQFPVDHARLVSSSEVTTNAVMGGTKGNKAPADPGEVLSREGEEAVGTSAGAVEEAMEDWDEDQEDAARPGDVIMRDRMLVRVGLHREELQKFDEAAQRRKPCARLEPMEEYIVIWRKGQVELYQDYRTPLREKISGHKHLCFVVPLVPNRTSLSIFNPIDMTLCLTTSISKLKTDAARLSRSKTEHKRTGALLANVKNSRQYQWLQKRSKGTQVFIIKIAEKSRAMDWYYELWRELGGELPNKIDIIVPDLNTSVRLAIPQSEDDTVGGVFQRRLLDANTVRGTCWDLLKESTDVDDLLRQREQSGIKGEPDLQLAWKGTDATLEWIAYSTTVQNKSRKWAVMAGIARSQVEDDRKDLQLRPARHQPQAMRLDDGTWLEEPPDVEGYLTRYVDSKSAKDQIYLSTHDGNIFVSNMKDAYPPLSPTAEGSTPANLFTDVYKVFLDNEHRRMASFIEHSAGCIDLRSIASVKLSENKDGKDSRMFEVQVDAGEIIRLEAHSDEIAKEWVERLLALKSYWARRHRVDARQRMDAMALQAHDDPFSGTAMSNTTDIALSEIWDWCVVDGCRPICLAGRIFMRKDKWDKFRSRYVVLAGGCLVTFKIKKKDSYFHRKKRYPLFGSYVYSGMLAQDELHETRNYTTMVPQARVYQDGLQASDGIEDTTFCIRLIVQPKKWGKKRTQPWELTEKDQVDFIPPELSKKPSALLIFRARSKLERDRWVWALNAEMERQVRDHVDQEEKLRNYGNVPERW